MLVAIVARALAVPGSSLTVAAPGNATVKKWSWLADTYWTVPK
jgi:hypothetical protein